MEAYRGLQGKVSASIEQLAVRLVEMTWITGIPGLRWISGMDITFRAKCRFHRHPKAVQKPDDENRVELRTSCSEDCP